jgi:hypothetical protein
MRDVADVGPPSRRCAVCEPVVSAREISKIAATPAPSSAAPRQWRTHLLGRLRRQVALTADTGLSRLLNELRAYPCDEPEPEVEIPGPGDIVVPLRLRYAGRELAFFSTVTTFGTPLDVTVSELAIESFFPADPETASILRNEE